MRLCSPRLAVRTIAVDIVIAAGAGGQPVPSRQRTPLPMRPVARLALVLCLAWSPPSQAADCAAEAVTYTLITDVEGERATIRFEPTAGSGEITDLDLVLRLAEPRPTEWRFGIAASSGYSLHHLLPPAGSGLSEADMQVIFFRRAAEGRFAAWDIPLKGTPAPDALLIPRLGAALWSGPSIDGERVTIDTEMWFARCP